MSEQKQFVQLHNHSEFSILDGASKTVDMANKALEIGSPAIAITDHGTMAGCVEFYKNCVKAGVKPIIGMEAYIMPFGKSRFEREKYHVKEMAGQVGHCRNNYHQILLAKNNKGYENLCSLHTKSYSQGYYYKPRIDHELLKEHSEGLIVSSACILGEVSHRLFCGDYDGAKKIAQWYKSVFGEDYYLEIMNHNLPMEMKVMAPIRELSKELGIKVIPTNDAHFINGGGEDHKLQKTLMLLGMGRSWSDADVSGSYYDEDTVQSKSLVDETGDSDPIFEMPGELYIKNYDEMLEVLRHGGGDDGIAEQELANTLEIAEKVSFEMPIIDPDDMTQYHTPVYPIEKDGRYEDFAASNFELEERTEKAVIEAMKTVKEGETLEDFFNDHELLSLKFLAWMAEEGLKDRVLPKIEAKGEPLPMSHWCENPPEGFKIEHTHNSPDELWLKSQDLERPETIVAHYHERMDYELSVVCRKGFMDYFSLVQMYCNYAKRCGSQVGPGRGSGAGSLLNYLIGITGVDPIPNNLLFARFLSPDRIGYPDIDVDFSKEFRDKQLKPYLREVFGEDNCSSVSTYMYFWGKAAIRAAARVLYPTSESVDASDALCDLLDDKPKLDLNTQLVEGDEGNASFKNLVNSNQMYRRIVDLALKIQGRVAGESIHASAFIVSPFAITDKMPMTITKDDRKESQRSGGSNANYTIAYDGSVTQDGLGYVKLDLLVLKDLEMIDWVLMTVERVYGCKIHIEKIPLDDKAVFDLLLDGHNAGIFQFDGSPVAIRILVESKADKIGDWAATNALNRPSPLEMGYDRDFIRGKRHPESVTYFSPAAEDILKNTYGVVCYQESLMLLSQKPEIVGLSGGQADHLRKCTAKKKPEAIAAMKEEVYEVAARNKADKAVTDYFWEIAVSAGKYSFNASHALAYALIAYWDAFLKVHFPEAFLAAMCTLKPKAKKVNKVPIYLEEARQLGVTVKPPHVNYSQASFDVPEKGIIAFGLGGINSVGQAANVIIEERNARGLFEDFTDFCTRVPKTVTKSALSALINAGALDNLGWSRMAMLESVEDIVDFRKKWFIEQDKLSVYSDSLFGEPYETEEGTASPHVKLTAPFDTEYTPRSILRKEYESFGMYFSGDPADFFQMSRKITEDKMNRNYAESVEANCFDVYRPVNLSEIASLPDGSKVEFLGNVMSCDGFNTKSGKKMGTVLVTDHGSMEESRFGFAPVTYKIKCTCFDRTWNSMIKPLPNDVVIVSGRVNVDKEGRFPTAVIVDTIETLPQDSELISSCDIETLTQIQQEIAVEKEKYRDPRNDVYMIPALMFKTQEDMESFKLDPDTEVKYGKKNGRVQISVLGNVGTEEMLALKATRGMVAHAARYGAQAIKIRLPKAETAINRAKMMEKSEC